MKVAGFGMNIFEFIKLPRKMDWREENGNRQWQGQTDILGSGVWVSK
jgi:hypothetical protein